MERDRDWERKMARDCCAGEGRGELQSQYFVVMSRCRFAAFTVIYYTAFEIYIQAYVCVSVRVYAKLCVRSRETNELRGSTAQSQLSRREQAGAGDVKV